MAGIFAIALIIALLPVMIYGFSFDTVTVNWNPTATASAAISDVMGSDSQDSSGFNDVTFSGDLTLHAEHVIYNPYSYVQTKFQGNVHASSSFTTQYLELLGIHLAITIHLKVVNPLGQSGQFDFYLTNLAGILNIDLVIGKDMMQIVNGTYYFELNATFSLDVNNVYSGSYNVNANGNIGVTILT